MPAGSRAHIPGMHFVVNTAENGAPFERSKYHGNKLNPAVCPTNPTMGIVAFG